MRHPVNFIVPYDDELVARLAGDSPERIVREQDSFLPVLSKGGVSAWCYLTYARLRDRGVQGIRLSNRAEPTAINVAHTDTLRLTPDYAEVFYAETRADHPSRLFPQFSIVQNQLQVGAHSAWISHWPQPGLVHRTKPIVEVRRIGYIGSPYNNNLAMTPETWRAMMAARGFEFVAPPADTWHDLSEYDALIAIRSFDAKAYPKKPASKLINAWLAGVPLIAGHDSAYKQVGTPSEDYLVAGSFDEVVTALEKLRGDAAFRERLLANGRKRARQYSDDATAARWIEVLDGPVADRFQEWRERPARERARATALKAVDQVLVFGKRHTKRLIAARSRAA